MSPCQMRSAIASAAESFEGTQKQHDTLNLGTDGFTTIRAPARCGYQADILSVEAHSSPHLATTPLAYLGQTRDTPCIHILSKKLCQLCRFTGWGVCIFSLRLANLTLVRSGCKGLWRC